MLCSGEQTKIWTYDYKCLVVMGCIKPLTTSMFMWLSKMTYLSVSSKLKGNWKEKKRDHHLQCYSCWFWDLKYPELCSSPWGHSALYVPCLLSLMSGVSFCFILNEESLISDAHTVVEILLFLYWIYESIHT